MDSSPKDEKENSLREYVLKALFPQRLVNVKKENSIGEIIEILKQVCFKISFLDAIKQVPSYAKFLKGICTKKRTIHAYKKTSLIEIHTPM